MSVVVVVTYLVNVSVMRRERLMWLVCLADVGLSRWGACVV